MIRLRRTLTGAALAGLLLGGGVLAVRAAEQPDPPPAQVEDTTSDAATTTARSERGADEDRAAEVFVPTEEISEDFAVSFPVDI